MDINPSKAGTVIERLPLNAGDAVANRDGGQAGAVRKRRNAYAGDAVGDGDAGQAGVFKSCFNLASVVFEGDIPLIYYDDLFSGANKVTVYYAPATSGWSPTFGGRPAVPKSLGQQTPLSIKIKTVQISMQVKPTKKYQLQASLDMQTWTNVGVAFVATATEEVQEFDITSTGRFFRLYELQ